MLASKKTRYIFSIDPEIHRRIKVLSAIQGRNMKSWITEAISTKLESEADTLGGLISQEEDEGIVQPEIRKY